MTGPSLKRRLLQSAENGVLVSPEAAFIVAGMLLGPSPDTAPWVATRTTLEEAATAAVAAVERASEPDISPLTTATAGPNIVVGGGARTFLPLQKWGARHAAGGPSPRGGRRYCSSGSQARHRTATRVSPRGYFIENCQLTASHPVRDTLCVLWRRLCGAPRLGPNWLASHVAPPLRRHKLGTTLKSACLEMGLALDGARRRAGAPAFGQPHPAWRLGAARLTATPAPYVASVTGCW